MKFHELFPSVLSFYNLTYFSNLALNKNFKSGQGASELVRYCVYSLDDSFTNPQKMWLNVEQPWESPTRWQIRKIRQASKLHQSDISTPIRSSQ